MQSYSLKDHKSIFPLYFVAMIMRRTWESNRSSIKFSLEAIKRGLLGGFLSGLLFSSGSPGKSYSRGAGRGRVSTHRGVAERH